MKALVIFLVIISLSAAVLPTAYDKQQDTQIKSLTDAMRSQNNTIATQNVTISNLLIKIKNQQLIIDTIKSTNNEIFFYYPLVARDSIQGVKGKSIVTLER